MTQKNCQLGLLQIKPVKEHAKQELNVETFVHCTERNKNLQDVLAKKSNIATVL